MLKTDRPLNEKYEPNKATTSARKSIEAAEKTAPDELRSNYDEAYLINR